MTLLDEINKEGTTVVVVTHSHEIVEQMGKRVIVMNRGDMIDDGMGEKAQAESDWFDDGQEGGDEA